MCGICGFYQLNNRKVSDSELKQMTESLSHRGPDDSGTILTDFGLEKYMLPQGKAGLGHNRLSIIDLSLTGHQPMFNKEHSIAIAYNGETYNFQEIKEQLLKKGIFFKGTSDTEVILYAYQNWGVRFVEKLQGMFAIAILDFNKETLFLFRDRVGIKPLYYFYQNGSFAFASEIKSLVRFPYFVKAVDFESVRDYYQNRYIPSPKTIFKETFKLEAGHYLEISQQGIIKHCYWDYIDKITKHEQTEDLSFLLDTLDEKMTHTVQSHLRSDVPVSVFLSGGIDSSLIAAYASHLSSNKIDTITIGFDEKQFDEAPYAKQIAQHFNTNHHEVYVSSKSLPDLIDDFAQTYDEPFGDSSAIPTLLLSQEASKITKVALAGDGGDELFYGYSWYRQMERYKCVSERIPYRIRQLLFSPIVIQALRQPLELTALSKSTLTEVYMEKTSALREWELLALLRQNRSEYLHDLSKLASQIRKRDVDFTRLLTTLGIKTYLPDDLLVKVDRASMAYSLEVRVPFLDHTLLEFSATLPRTMLKNKGKQKWAMKELLRKYLPEHLSERPKKGFSVPMGKWLRGSLKETLFQYLNKKSLWAEEALDMNYIARCNFEHQNNIRDHTNVLWLTLGLLMWEDYHLK